MVSSMLENAVGGSGSTGAVCEPQAVREAGNVPELPENKAVEKVYKVQIGIPLKGGTPARSYHDRMMMFKYVGNKEAEQFYEKVSPRYSFGFGAIGEMLVPYARERLAESCLEVGADYLFMIDDDMLAPPDIIHQLLKHDKDIVAALAFTRNPDHKPVIYETIEGFDKSVDQSYGMTRFVMNYPRNTLVECDAVGFGAVLIKTDVFRKVKQPWFFGMERTGEDITLCIKARKAGFSVWMDTSIKMGHLGANCIITEEYHDAWTKLTPEEREKMYGRYQKYETNYEPR